jgi:hypothetical protein
MSARPDQPLRLATILTVAALAAFVAVPAHAQHPTAVTSIVNSDADTTLEVNYNGSLLMPGTLISDGTAEDSIPAEGAGVRMMWYPSKAAFRAGRVGFQKDGTQWDASNVARGSVAFGTDTKASGPSASAMGYKTTASAVQATAMGLETTASGSRATAMGNGTTASGDNATAMGEGTTASASWATAMGNGGTASANYAVAMGVNTTASGAGATAMGGTTTASGDAATTMGTGTLASALSATAMGDETIAATDNSLSIGEYNSANRDPDGDGIGDNTLFVAGNGDGGNLPSSRSDALVLKQDGDLAVGPSNPQDLRLFVQDEKDNAGVKDDPSANMALFKNTSTGSKPDVMGLQAGPSSPGAGVAYLTFYDRTGTTVGQVEGNGAGGVNYTSSGSDFAEELPVGKGASSPEPADLVGVNGGKVRLDTEDADRVMVVSEAPAMTGNTPSSAEEDDARRVPVAFVGQVPAIVRGPAEVGDLIVASGRDDGTGRAVAPSEYRRAEHGPIAGQAWSAKNTSSVGEVTVAVGLGRSGAVAEQLEEQRRTNQRQEAQIEDLENRLAALESERSPSVVAGWAGSGTGLLLAFLIGGLLGVGLLWRRRG